VFSKKSSNYCILYLGLLFFMLSPVSIISSLATNNDLAVPTLKIGDASELEAFLDTLIQTKMEQLHIPGVQFALVKNGEIFLAKGYGYANLENKIPVHPDRTLFRICSIAKVVTGTAVMQLVEQGKIDLDKDINEYITLFKIQNPFPQPVTMRHLLTHTAGFDDVYMNKVGRTPEVQLPLGEFLANHLPPVITPPGEVSTYSNLGNALAGYLVELISGQDFAEYAAEYIFKPLEMRHSSFRLPDSLAPDLVTGYYYKNEDYMPIAFDYLNDYPAGQMVSTATDMTKFLIAHLQKGKYKDQRILEESTIQKMHSVQFKHHQKLEGASAFTFGIGSIRGQKLLAHDGGYVDASTRLWLLPESNIGIYMACNTMNSQLNNDVTNSLMERFFPAVEKDTAMTYPLQYLPTYDPDVYRFVGTYRFTRYTHGSLTKTGILFGMIAPEFSLWKNDGEKIMMNDLQGNPRRMIQIEPLLFQSVDDDYYCAFRQDVNGNITHLFTNGTAAFEKVPWFYTIEFQRIFFFTSFTILFMTALVIAVQFIVHKKKRKKVNRSLIEKRLRSFAWLSSFILLFYLLTFGIVLLSIPQHEAMIGFGYGLPKIIYVAQVIPFIGIIFLLVTLFFLIKSWFKNDSTILKRILFSIVTLAAFGFVWFLNYWNLLGWRF